MHVPEGAFELIKLQRSGYTDIIPDYINDMEKEYNDIKAFLPNNAKHILDIGCGICGLDVLISEHYNNDVNLNLVDKNKVEKDLWYGYKANTPFYNSFDVAKEMLNINNIKNYKFISAENGNDLPQLEKQDLICSFLSCGYHYPVEKYLYHMYHLLSDDGCIILDIRQNTNGMESIKRFFPDITIISTYNKSNRIKAKRSI